MKQETVFRLGSVAGSLATGAVFMLSQDIYGSKEAYIRHLQELPSWRWIDGVWAGMMIAALFAASVAITFYAVVNDKDSR